jgi:hypothetical protein
MITIKDFMEVVDYRITEGSDFLWQCFGPNAYCLDSWNSNFEGYSIGITFDTKHQTVYKFEAHDYSRNNSYRWIHPDWKEIAANEARNRGIDHSEAWDDVKYIDLDLAEDMLEKARAIANGVDYDERIKVPLELPDSLMNKLFRLAHEQDITLNELVENILKEELKIQ